MTPLIISGAHVELTIPSPIEANKIDATTFGRRRNLRMGMQLELNDVAIVEPGGKRIVIPRLILTGLSGIMVPVMEGDRVVLFKMDEVADKPITVEGNT